jgi:hypothetical protein
MRSVSLKPIANFEVGDLPSLMNGFFDALYQCALQTLWPVDYF